MKKLSENEMKEISAGANYEKSCPNGCGTVIGTYYFGWSSLSYLVARVVVDGSMHNHVVECTYNMATE